jgi:hypothetical protein
LRTTTFCTPVPVSLVRIPRVLPADCQAPVSKRSPSTTSQDCDASWIPPERVALPEP